MPGQHELRRLARDLDVPVLAVADTDDGAPWTCLPPGPRPGHRDRFFAVDPG